MRQLATAIKIRELVTAVKTFNTICSIFRRSYVASSIFGNRNVQFDCSPFTMFVWNSSFAGSTLLVAPQSCWLRLLLLLLELFLRYMIWKYIWHSGSLRYQLLYEQLILFSVYFLRWKTYVYSINQPDSVQKLKKLRVAWTILFLIS